MMLEHTLNQKLSIIQVVEKMCHAPAICFNIKKRGFLKEGYYADMVAVKDKSSWTVNKDNILYHCGWSPLENKKFNFRVSHTFVNGNLVYKDGEIVNGINGQELEFES